MIPTFPFSLSALCSPPRDMVCGASVGLLGPEAALRSFRALRAFSALGPLRPWGPWEAFGALAGTASLLDVQWLYPRLGSGESAHRQSRDTWCLVTRPSQTLEGNSTAIAVIITTRPMPRPGLASRLRHKSLPHPSIHLCRYNDMGQQKNTIHFQIHSHIQPMNWFAISRIVEQRFHYKIFCSSAGAHALQQGPRRVVRIPREI